jgi:hypothetical protein
MIQLHDCAGVEKISSQRLAFSPIGDDIFGHRIRNFGQTPPDLIDFKNRTSLLEFVLDSFYIGNVQPRGVSCRLDQSDHHSLMLPKTKRLKGTKDTVFIDYFDVEGHAVIVHFKIAADASFLFARNSLQNP